MFLGRNNSLSGQPIPSSTRAPSRVQAECQAGFYGDDQVCAGFRALKDGLSFQLFEHRQRVGFIFILFHGFRTNHFVFRKKSAPLLSTTGGSNANLGEVITQLFGTKAGDGQMLKIRETLPDEETRALYGVRDSLDGQFEAIR
jgi:hypothetical protein